MKSSFFVLLSEYIKKAGFTKKRIEDAVDHVCMNFAYKELNISDVIRFDRRIKLYTHSEVHKLTGEVPHPDFEKRIIDGKHYFVKKSDIL